MCVRVGVYDFQMVRFLDLWKETGNQSSWDKEEGEGVGEGVWREESRPHIREQEFLHPGPMAGTARERNLSYT